MPPAFSAALVDLSAQLDPRELEMVAASLPGVEVYFPHVEGVAGGRAALAAAFGTDGSRIRSLHAGWRDVSDLNEGAWRAAAAQAQQNLKMAAELGARVVVYHPSGEPVPAEKRPRRMRRSLKAFEAMAPAVERLGLRVAIEFLPRTCLCNCLDEIRWMLDRLPAGQFGACMDTNHMMDRFREVPDVIRQLGPRLVEVHLSDYDGVDEKHQLPGAGVVDWPGVMRALREIGFAGPLNYEVSFKGVPFESRLETLRENMAWLGGLLSRPA